MQVAIAGTVARPVARAVEHDERALLARRIARRQRYPCVIDRELGHRRYRRYASTRKNAVAWASVRECPPTAAPAKLWQRRRALVNEAPKPAPRRPLEPLRIAGG